MSGFGGGTGVIPVGAAESYLALQLSTGELDNTGHTDMVPANLIPTATSFSEDADPDGWYTAHPSPSFTCPAGKGGLYAVEFTMRPSDMVIGAAPQASFWLDVNGDSGNALDALRIQKGNGIDQADAPGRTGLYVFADGDVVTPKFACDTATGDAGFTIKLWRIISRGPRGVQGPQGDDGDPEASARFPACQVNLFVGASDIDPGGPGAVAEEVLADQFFYNHPTLPFTIDGDDRLNAPLAGVYLVEVYASLHRDEPGLGGVGPAALIVVNAAGGGYNIGQTNKRASTSETMVLRHTATIWLPAPGVIPLYAINYQVGGEPIAFEEFSAWVYRIGPATAEAV